MRKNKIYDLINRQERISVSELSEHFTVSVETIRRDLRSLEKKGLITRTHGGAISNKVKAIDLTIDRRVKYHLKQKKILAQYAASLIKEKSTIGLDASTTSQLIARSISNIDCTVITNSSYIVNELERKNRISVICVGGNYSAKKKSFYGIMAMNNLEKFALDMSFLSCTGFDLDTGIWESNDPTRQITQSFLKASRKTTFIIDNAQINKRSLLKICNIENVDNLISYANFTTEEKRKLASNSIKYHYVAIE